MAPLVCKCKRNWATLHPPTHALNPHPPPCSTNPYTDKGPTWQQAVQWVREVEVAPGQELDLTASHDTYSISFALPPELDGDGGSAGGAGGTAAQPQATGGAGSTEGAAAADGGSVSGWARAGMADAVALGLFGGTQDTGGRVWLRPGESATRAEIAAVLARFGRNVAHLL